MSDYHIKIYEALLVKKHTISYKRKLYTGGALFCFSCFIPVALETFVRACKIRD